MSLLKTVSESTAQVGASVKPALKKIKSYISAFYPFSNSLYGNALFNEHTLTLPAFKKVFDQHLETFVNKKITESKVICSNKIIQALFEHTLVITTSGGKRVRPFIAYLAYKTEGGMNDELIMNALVGIELFHIFALIHDDIIDKASERHGVKTLHALASEMYKELYAHQNFEGLINDEEIILKSNSQAMLVGDAVFSWAQEAFEYSVIETSNNNIQNIFRNMVEEVVIGQMIDVDLIKNLKTNLEEITLKNNLKTARYTFVNPLKIGVSLAGGDVMRLSVYDTFGTAVGIAFQMQDDLLDIIGSSKKTGKDVLIDLEEGQPTVFTQFILETNTSPHAEDDKKELKQYFGKKLSTAQKLEAVKLFERSGALQYGRTSIEDYSNQAENEVDTFLVKNSYQKVWKDFVSLLRSRVS